MPAPASTASLPFALPDVPVEADLLAKYFRGLGDPTRVRILELLDAHEELSVGELVERLAQSQSKVSNHLACLRWCGFVATRREHPSVFYRVADGRVAELLSLGRALLADNEEHVSCCQTLGARNV
jgi:DNA-binding transcriptional ArsR family regulator